MITDNYYTGAIAMFANAYVPDGWMPCCGQLLQVMDYPELFSIIGTTYGGNGSTNFALPNLNGRFPLGDSHQFPLGTELGSADVYIPEDAVPTHSHAFQVSSQLASSPSGEGQVLAQANSRFATSIYAPYDEAKEVLMNPNAISEVGSGSAPNHLPPYLTLIFGICYSGQYPMRP
jgi:microcystin-dependent protein